jgi:hypothetical protein
MKDYVLGKPFVFGSLFSPEMATKGLTQAHLESLAGLTPGAAPTTAKAAPGKKH